MGLAAEPFGQGRARVLVRAAELLTAGGAVLALCRGRDRRLAMAAGTALLTGSAALRFGVFHAGVASAEDPAYTVVPQREAPGGAGRVGPVVRFRSAVRHVASWPTPRRPARRAADARDQPGNRPVERRCQRRSA